MTTYRYRAGALDIESGPAYHSGMVAFRIAVKILAVIHALLVGLTALAGAFADGGDIWQRLVVVLLHPAGAIALLVLVFARRLATTATLAIASLLLVNVIADLALALAIGTDLLKGDWELGLMFAAVPAIGIGYALSLRHSGHPVAN